MTSLANVMAGELIQPDAHQELCTSK